MQMYKDAPRVRYSPKPSSSPIRSSSSSVIISDPFQSNTSTLRKRAPMPDSGDALHHPIQLTPSGSSSGTTPPVATHDEPPPASALSSPIPSSPPDIQAVETTAETKSSIDVATHPPARDPALPVDPNLRQTTWGIFKVAYVVSSIPFLSFAMLAEYRKGGKVLYRLLKELWIVDWQHCLEYYACTLWLIVSPSFSLCFAYLVVLNLERLINRQGSGLAPELQEVQYLAIMWLFSGMLSDRIELNMLRIRADFGGHLRPFFTPRLVKARFEIDPADSPSGFPAAHDYGDFIPGWDFFDDFFIRLRIILTICFEVATMGYIISREEGRSVNPLGSNVLGILVAAPLILTFIAPTNGAGSAGYAFWTTNREYNQLKVLFNMVFHSSYLPLLIKDGLADSILEEYNRVTAALGVVRADTWILGWQIPSPWYWNIPLTWTVNHPMALCALVFPFISSTSMITTVALLQYATSTMHNSAKSLRNLMARLSVLQIMRNIEQFYDVLDSPAAPRGTLDYPNAKSLKGSRFTLKDVSYKYASQMAPAINNVNLDIAPGQLVLIVGENGSGKSTLLKILSGLVNPTEGEVLLDHTALSRYDVNAFRRATAFVTQGEGIYPVSLRDNMLMCLSDDGNRESITQEDLTEAARLGGSLDFIEKLSQRFDTVLEPCSIPAWSFTLFPAHAALDAMNRDYPFPEPVGISPGEKQRLIASKAFMKIKHTETKLIILDEATNSLDSRAERKIFDQFIQISRESGQTLIIVAHRLSHIALQADQILFMKDGKLEEKGTHEELMARSQHGYAKLYNAELANPVA